MEILAYVLMFGAAAAFIAVGLRGTGPDDRDPEVYLRSLDEDLAQADEFAQLLETQSFVSRILRPLGGRIATTAASVLPGNYRDDVHHKLVVGGLTGQIRAEEIISAQIALALTGFVGALFYATVGGASSRVGVLLLVGAPLVAGLLPQVYVNRKIEERKSAIVKDLPDVLDLLAISVEAGMGFEGAMGIVGDQFDSVLAVEFARTIKEMELGLTRSAALLNLKRRTEVPDLSNFVQAMLQADALGMPIGRVLKTQAHEMRAKRRAAAREQAARLPVKMLFPMIGFIFPTIFIVVLYPAFSDISAAF